MRTCANCKIKIGHGHIYQRSIKYGGYYVCRGCNHDLKREIITGKKTSTRNLNHKLGILMDTKSEEITDILTQEGIKKLSKDQVLIFDNEGTKTELKITRIAKGRVWAKRIRTYSTDEVAITDKEEK